MDVPEEKYRKIINDFRPIFANLLNENPINSFNRQPDPNTRNLKYIVTKAILSDNYPYYNPIFQEVLEEIKTSMGEGGS